MTEINLMDKVPIWSIYVFTVVFLFLAAEVVIALAQIQMVSTFTLFPFRSAGSSRISTPRQGMSAPRWSLLPSQLPGSLCSEISW